MQVFLAFRFGLALEVMRSSCSFILLRRISCFRVYSSLQQFNLLPYVQTSCRDGIGATKRRMGLVGRSLFLVL